MTKTKKRPISSIMNKISEWGKQVLLRSRDTYFHFLPSPTGTLSALFLERLFSGVFIGREQEDILKGIPKDAIIVYTSKYKSRFEFLFSHTRYRQLRLPTPQLSLDYGIYLWQPLSRVFRIVLGWTEELLRNRRLQDPYRNDYVQEELLTSNCAMLTLVQKKGFYRRFVKSKTDPLGYLIKMQKKIERPIYLVPQLMFYGKKPSPAVPTLQDMIFGTSQKPGIVRKIVTLVRRPGKIFVELSQPLNLKQWTNHAVQAEKSISRQALELRRLLMDQHNRHRQSITGPLLKTNEELKESILTGNKLRAYIKKYAISRQEPIQKVRKKADGYIEEIAARYSLTVIRVMSYVVGWIINSMFDGAVLDKQGLARVKAMSMKGPLILIPCHKSHIDYLILSYVLYNNNMPCPHIAAGKNLSFWPLGPIFRGGGAFFLRRTFKGAPLYARVFSAYIHKLLEEGFNIELFIEGGRSRSGKLLMPKLGFLSILLDACKQGACANMVFVPVYIGYDRIIEERAYIHEVEGGKKEDENLSQVIRARRFLKKRYGKIYINFDEPITMSELLADSSLPLDRMPQKEVNALCRNLGWRIINAIDKQTVVTPYGLVAAAVLNTTKRRFSKMELMTIANTYLTCVTVQNAKLADTLLLNPDGAMDYTFDRYLARKWIEKAPGDKKTPDDQADYMANTGKRSLLEFYKNNCISYFIPSAFTALAILKTDAFQFVSTSLYQEYQTLQTFFKYEFAFDQNRSEAREIRKTIKTFIDDAILMPHRTIPDSYQITSSGFRKLKLFAAFLKPYFESYKVVLSFLRSNRKEKLDTKDKLKRIQNIGLQMIKSNEIDLIESVSKINYTNGLSFFANSGVKSHENEDLIVHFETLIQHYLQVLNG